MKQLAEHPVERTSTEPPPPTWGKRKLPLPAATNSSGAGGGR